MLTYITGREIGSFAERIYKHESDYPVVLEAHFGLHYHTELDRLGIDDVSIYIENSSKLGSLTPEEKAMFVGNSTLTIGNYSIVLPIEESNLGTGSSIANSIYWSSIWYPDLEKLYVYDDSTETGAFAFTGEIPYTWEFPGYTHTGVIKVLESYHDYIVDHIKYYVDYTPYNFTDYGTNPSIDVRISDNSLNLKQKIEIGLSSNGYSDDVMEFTENEGIYPWNDNLIPLNLELTQEAKQRLWALSSDNYYIDVYYLVRITWTHGLTATHAVKAICELSKLPPSMAPTVVDMSSVTTSLTGDPSKLIRFMSIAKYEINGNGGTGSSIVQQYVINNGIRYEGPSGRIDNVENGVFKFYLINNRNYTLEERVELDVIPYVRLTCNVSYVNVPDPETGDIKFQLKGNCFNGSFGAASNALVVQYRYKENTASQYGSWVNVPSSKINRLTQPENTWNTTSTIPGLDYTKTYQVQFRAVDSLATATTQIVRVTTTPVFDWSKEDFKTNVPTIINGWTYGSNVLLWEGKMQMTADETAYLNWPLQYIPHGIVLIFSAANGDVSWSTHFVPKEMISINKGGGQTFIMANNAGLANFGSKYLYIYDDMIQGHGSNDTGITTHTDSSSITSNNAHFVLRYVYGV